MTRVEGKILLASSALKEEGFDSLKTIEVARIYAYPGCQLFLDEKYLAGEYLEQVIFKLRQIRRSQTDFSIVIHLPDAENFSDNLIEAAWRLAAEIEDLHFLIHSVNGNEVKEIGGVAVGLENRKKGVFDPKEVGAVWDRVLARDLPMVLDFGRFWYGPEEMTEKIIAFTKWQILRLDPDKGDMIHLTDKVKMADFRTNACVMGDGLAVRVLPEIISFLQKGGIVVLEYEDLAMENASRDYLVELLG